MKVKKMRSGTEGAAWERESEGFYLHGPDWRQKAQDRKDREKRQRSLERVYADVRARGGVV